MNVTAGLLRIPLGVLSKSRRRVMIRIEAVLAWGFLAALTVAFVLIGVVSVWGMPNVVTCLDKNAYGPTAMDVEVTSNRRGHIVERHALGCTFYFYEPPPFH
jgi:hypothetical protein